MAFRDPPNVIGLPWRPCRSSGQDLPEAGTQPVRRIGLTNA
ncbi:hypothetical protein ABZZ47_09315 [Streptomyces sp. NPDC006465]